MPQRQRIIVQYSCRHADWVRAMRSLDAQPVDEWPNSCHHAPQVDPVRNLLYVRGQVPGHKGNFVYIADSVKKTTEQQPPRPVPTYRGDDLLGETIAPPTGPDPFAYQES